MGVPLAHIPDQVADGHASYARHHAQAVHRHVRGSRRPPGPLLLDERASTPTGEMDSLHPDRARQGARVVREIYRRVANVQHPDTWHPVSRDLRDVRPGRHDDRHRSGTASGCSSSAAPELVTWARGLRLVGLGLAVRRAGEAALEPRVGGAVVAVRGDDRAVRQGPRHRRRLARPLRRRSRARCSSASRRSTSRTSS